MNVSRKGAWIMLAIVVLWAAIPGLACLAPAPRHACCTQMMQDCGPSMAMADHACCKVQSQDPNTPPVQASRPDPSSLLADASQGDFGAILPVVTTFSVLSSETPPGPSASPHRSILRI